MGAGMKPTKTSDGLEPINFARIVCGAILAIAERLRLRSKVNTPWRTNAPEHSVLS
jgi:hypothetical protein